MSVGAYSVNLLLSVLVAADGPSRCPNADKTRAKEPKIRNELLVMMHRDQNARSRMLKAFGDSGFSIGQLKFSDQKVRMTIEAESKLLAEIDRKNRVRLAEIIERFGWPGKSLVGTEGAHAAWLLAQHSNADLPFQKNCLRLMQRAPPGEVEPKDIAYLVDRILVAEMKKQIYGTQLTENLTPRSMEDPKNVDERRRRVGLPPLAEYLRMAKDIYSKPSERPAEKM